MQSIASYLELLVSVAWGVICILVFAFSNRVGLVMLVASIAASLVASFYANSRQKALTRMLVGYATLAVALALQNMTFPEKWAMMN